MTATDFVLFNRSDRRVLAARLTTVLDQWRDEWFAGEAAPAEATLFEGDDASPLAGYAWRTGALPGGAAVSVGIATAAAPLAAGLIGERARTTAEGRERPPIERELEQAAVDDLIVRLLHGSPAAANVAWDTKPPGAEVAEPHRGYAVATCRVDAVELRIVLYPRVARDVLAAARPVKKPVPGVSPVRGVVASRKVAARVCAGGAELLLSELADLAVGDVITLDRRLDQPMAVRIAGGGDLCAGYLGVFQGRKAIQLTTTDSNDGV